MSALKISARLAGTSAAEQEAFDLLAAQAVVRSSGGSAPSPPVDTGPSRSLVLTAGRALALTDSRHVQVY
jgi:hypothetical protein